MMMSPGRRRRAIQDALTSCQKSTSVSLPPEMADQSPEMRLFNVSIERRISEIPINMNLFLRVIILLHLLGKIALQVRLQPVERYDLKAVLRVQCCVPPKSSQHRFL